MPFIVHIRRPAWSMLHEYKAVISQTLQRLSTVDAKLLLTTWSSCLFVPSTLAFISHAFSSIDPPSRYYKTVPLDLAKSVFSPLHAMWFSHQDVSTDRIELEFSFFQPKCLNLTRQQQLLFNLSKLICQRQSSQGSYSRRILMIPANLTALCKTQPLNSWHSMSQALRGVTTYSWTLCWHSLSSLLRVR